VYSRMSIPESSLCSAGLQPGIFLLPSVLTYETQDAALNGGRYENRGECSSDSEGYFEAWLFIN
jgi:hypothetical protein